VVFISFAHFTVPDFSVLMWVCYEGETPVYRARKDRIKAASTADVLAREDTTGIEVKCGLATSSNRPRTSHFDGFTEWRWQQPTQHRSVPLARRTLHEAAITAQRI
jgi:hypothetical protein